MPYNEHDKHIWNKGYYAGVKYIVLQIVSYLNGYSKPECFNCGEERTFMLQLAHIEPLKQLQRINWNTWKKVDELKILCNRCHTEDGY